MTEFLRMDGGAYITLEHSIREGGGPGTEAESARLEMSAYRQSYQDWLAANNRTETPA